MKEDEKEQTQESITPLPPWEAKEQEARTKKFEAEARLINAQANALEISNRTD